MSFMHVSILRQAKTCFSSLSTEFLCVCRDEKKIHFYDPDLTRVLLYPMESQHQPKRLWTASPTTLLYEDFDPKHNVFALDCKTNPPQHVGSSLGQAENIADMCFVQDGGNTLGVRVHHSGQLDSSNFATNTVWPEQKEKIMGLFPSVKNKCVTGDNQGHLFLWNNDKKSINVYKKTPGGDFTDQGVLLEPENEGLGVPVRMGWLKNGSYLVLLCQKMRETMPDDVFACKLQYDIVFLAVTKQ